MSTQTSPDPAPAKKAARKRAPAADKPAKAVAKPARRPRTPKAPAEQAPAESQAPAEPAERQAPSPPTDMDPFLVDPNAERPAWLADMAPAMRRVYYLVHPTWAEEPQARSRTTQTLGAPSDFFENYGPAGDPESEDVTDEDFVQALFSMARRGLRCIVNGQ